MIVELARLGYGGALLADASVVGSYDYYNERRQQTVTLPILDVNQIILRDRGILAKDRKTTGHVTCRLDPETMTMTGRALEYIDGRGEMQAIYNTTRLERLAMRGKRQSGKPAQYGLHWSRLVRGPMSPTLEDEDVSVNSTPSSTLVLSLTGATAGNLLVAVPGYYYFDASVNFPTITDFTRRVTGGNGNFEVNQSILDKIAVGGETNLTVNFTTSQENSGWIGEYSGMTSSPYVGSGSTDPATTNVTSRSSGTVDTATPSKPNCLLIAAWGLEQSASPATFTYAPTSFVEEASVNGTQGESDHMTRVATRVVSASSAAYECTMSWTNAVEAAGVIAAYEYSTATVPDAPTGLGATANGATEIDLSWTAPASDGGSPILGYLIERESPTGNGFDVLAGNTGTTSTTFTDTNLTPGTQYNYRISAINAMGIGAASTAAADTTTAATAPGAPTGVGATAETPTTNLLTWTAPVSDGGSPITGYKIERESPTGGGFATIVGSTGSTTTEYRDAGLTAATQYNYKISAINDIGTSAASSASAVTTVNVASNDSLSQMGFRLRGLARVPPVAEGAVLDQADRQQLLALPRNPLVQVVGAGAAAALAGTLSGVLEGVV